MRLLKRRADLNYQQLSENLRTLSDKHGCELLSIGRSVLGRELWTIRLGWGARSVYINGAHHACEWLTASLLLAFIQAYLEAREAASPLWGIDIGEASSRASLWITPMVNPDGVALAKEGLDAIPQQYHSTLLKWNYGNPNFREWKANIRGVDLNRQYRADWLKAYESSPKTPAPKYFAGEHPESEPEAKAVADFTRKLKPEFVIAYHSQGEVIYWNYRRKAPPEARRIAKELSRLTGYALVGHNPREAGYGGYKDWFISHFHRPGFTIEIGRGMNPLPLAQFNSIWQKNAPLLANLANYVLNL
ncbi:MAG: peptidase M14 [Firmicutes bacterium]|nr:peptidase M14 [Bacillota bacterium]